MTTISEHSLRFGDHTTAFLEAGPSDGPLIVFVHGWPELSLSWRHQLPAFAERGFRVVAPDMRGYGRSTVYPKTHDYAQRLIVDDLIELVDALDCERAIWVGHDWGSPGVWNVASHHPERCHAVASLCVPYRTLEFGYEACLPLLDRDVYPADTFPLGQWEYQGYYEESFERATAVMDAHPYNMVKALFRKGRPEGAGKPAGTAFVRIQNGWFQGADEPPDVPADTDVISLSELQQYAEALETNGFFGPNAFYMNHAANARYAAEAVNDGRLDMP
ncbi:MAG: alpha/beta hydrolase, partial [Pseudomonadota bacterium]